MKSKKLSQGVTVKINPRFIYGVKNYLEDGVPCIASLQKLTGVEKLEKETLLQASVGDGRKCEPREPTSSLSNDDEAREYPNKQVSSELLQSEKQPCKKTSVESSPNVLEFEDHKQQHQFFYDSTSEEQQSNKTLRSKSEIQHVSSLEGGAKIKAAIATLPPDDDEESYGFVARKLVFDDCGDASYQMLITHQHDAIGQSGTGQDEQRAPLSMFDDDEDHNNRQLPRVGAGLENMVPQDDKTWDGHTHVESMEYNQHEKEEGGSGHGGSDHDDRDDEIGGGDDDEEALARQLRALLAGAGAAAGEDGEEQEEGSLLDPTGTDGEAGVGDGGGSEDGEECEVGGGGEWSAAGGGRCGGEAGGGGGGGELAALEALVLAQSTKSVFGLMINGKKKKHQELIDMGIAPLPKSPFSPEPS